MADDMGYECLGAYGSDSYFTPVLDELAAKGGFAGADVTDDHVQPAAKAQGEFQFLEAVQVLTGPVKKVRVRGIGERLPIEIENAEIVQNRDFAVWFAGGCLRPLRVERITPLVTGRLDSTGLIPAVVAMQTMDRSLGSVDPYSAFSAAG
jgi:hypothetical protein